jgi:hypothetical protein
MLLLDLLQAYDDLPFGIKLHVHYALRVGNDAARKILLEQYNDDPKFKTFEIAFRAAGYRWWWEK